MELLGKVVNFSPKGSLVIRATAAPTTGQNVVDRRQRPIGRIVKVTGPVVSPYVIVAPVRDLEGPMNRLLGTEVFLQPAPPVRQVRDRQTDQGGPRKPQFHPRQRAPYPREGHRGRRDRPRKL